MTLNWPVDGGARLPVDLSGLPIYDPERNFIGYRGFGICRDLDGLAWLTWLRHAEFGNVPQAQHLHSPAPRSLSADIARNAGVVAEPGGKLRPVPEPIVRETLNPLEPDTSVEPPKNVLPFRPVNEGRRSPATPVENNAFNELARQLATRLEAESSLTREAEPMPASDATGTDSAAGPPAFEAPDAGPGPASAPERAPDGEQPEWLSPAEPPAQGEMQRDKLLFDLLPVGVLIYRLDRLLYANRAFLDRIGYPSLQALEAADGLDALFVEPVGPQGSSTPDAGAAAVTIAATLATAGHDPLPPTEARLFTISWDGEAALALICSNSRLEQTAPARAVAVPVPEPSPVEEAASPVEQAVSPVGQANAEELGAILDTMAKGA